MLSPHIHSNPLKDPDLPRRFAELIIEYQIERQFSDKQFAEKLREVTGGRRQTKNSIARWRDKKGGIPGLQAIGDIQKALDIPKNRIQRMLYPTSTDADILPSIDEYKTEWAQVVAYLNRQTNLSIEITANQRKAADALKNDNALLAKKYLMEIEKSASYSADYYSDQHANALASLGSLSIATGEFEDAITWYERAIGQRGVEHGQLKEYKRSARLALHGMMNACENDASRRELLNKMISLNIHRTEKTYGILIANSINLDCAKKIFREIENDQIIPSRISFHLLLKKSENIEEYNDSMYFLMENYAIVPSDDSICIAIKLFNHFNETTEFLNKCKDDGYFTGRSSYEAAFAKNITHLSSMDLLNIYFSMPFRFKTALSNPINQYIHAGQIRSALEISLVSPSLIASQKLYIQNFDAAVNYFESVLDGTSNDISKYFKNYDVHYALGIARLLHKDFKAAIADLKFAKAGTADQVRIRYISEIIQRGRRGIVDLYVKKGK